MSTTDLEKATRELFVRSYVDQIHMRTPFLEELQRRHQVTHKAGKYIERLIDTDDVDDLVQTYTVNDSLTDDRKETLEKPRFTWRKSQIPVRWDADEELENFEGDEDTQLLDLSEFLIGKCQKGMRKWFAKQIFNNGSTTPIADGDTSNWQSLISALKSQRIF